MYGILLESVRTTIIESFGIEVWTEIAEYLDFDVNEVNPHSIYSDHLFSQIIEGNNLTK